MSDRISDDDEPLGLRERRRRETLRELSDAAIDLFERQGVHATTVDDIAHVVGISQRTFFRYYPTKERAVFLREEGSDSIMHDTIEAVRRGEPVVRTVERGWMAVFDDFDARTEDHPRTLRVRRLVQAEPSLLAIALAQEAESTQEFVAAAAHATGSDADSLVTGAVVAIIGTAARIAFDEWARRAERGESASVRAVYLELRGGIASYATELANPE